MKKQSGLGRGLSALLDDPNLDFTQQSVRDGAASDLTRQAEDLEATAEELYNAIDALSNILLFRFKEV